MARQSKQDKLIDAEINKIYCQTFSGVQVDIMELPKIFQIGKKAYLAGEDIKQAMIEYVNSIRKN